MAYGTWNRTGSRAPRSCLDLASAGGVLLAAAYAARGIAANAARWFSYSQGNKFVNKDNIAKKMLDLADSLEKSYENNISLASTTVTVMSFNDSGSAFEGYDTGQAYLTTGL